MSYLLSIGDSRYYRETVKNAVHVPVLLLVLPLGFAFLVLASLESLRPRSFGLVVLYPVWNILTNFVGVGIAMPVWYVRNISWCVVSLLLM